MEEGGVTALMFAMNDIRTTSLSGPLIANKVNLDKKCLGSREMFGKRGECGKMGDLGAERLG